VSRGKDPRTGYQSATAEGRVINNQRSLPWELGAGCWLATGGAQGIIPQIDLPSGSCAEINLFIISYLCNIP
jgi:hypothetical protein